MLLQFIIRAFYDKEDEDGHYAALTLSRDLLEECPRLLQEARAKDPRLTTLGFLCGEAVMFNEFDGMDRLAPGSTETLSDYVFDHQFVILTEPIEIPTAARIRHDDVMMDVTEKGITWRTRSMGEELVSPLVTFPELEKLLSEVDRG